MDRFRDQITPLTLAGVLLLLSVMLIGPAAEAMGALRPSIHRAIAADNFVTGCLALLALYVRTLGYRWRSMWSPLDLSLHRWGEALLIIGLLLHRPYWVPWRSALEYGDQAFANWWRDDLAILTSIGQSCWWLGLILIAYPQLRMWLPRGWPYAMAATVVALWMIGYQFVDLLAALILKV